KKLGIPATLSDPWQMVSYPPILQPKIESIGAAFSAAIGLALYGSAEAEKRKKNQS
ncbi:MAG: hypothetical protein HGA33_01105, partial [Candidatus Moranbacteria bacterium]|nr:hypothetical protein [Candidatus Moranbacteria bacterium]